MRPGKSPTPRREIDLDKIWRELGEDPPGDIRSVERVARQVAHGSAGRSRPAATPGV